MKRTLYVAAIGLSLLAISPSFAADGYVTGNVNLRAGPDTNYPSVVMLPAGAEVAIDGCVDGWSWCDVVAGENRGWVAGSFLQEEYQGQRVRVPEYGVRIGIPVVSFVFGTYWEDNYRNRSWYGNRQQWSHITPRYHSTGAHGDRYDNLHEDTNPHPRNTSVDASHAPGHHTGAASTQHEVAVTHPARPDTSLRPTAPHHAVASETRVPERNANLVKPTEQRAASSASAPRTVAVRSAPQHEIGTEHKAANPKAARTPVAQKTAPEKKDDNSKDEH
jgi:uncharacterized protein YraI